MTNADRIRAMSDEELAEVLKGLSRSAYSCPPYEGKCPGYCVECWLDWLEQKKGANE